MQRSPLSQRELVEMQRDIRLAKLASHLITIHTQVIAKIEQLDDIVRNKRGPKGDKGERGEKGEKGDSIIPRKGIDYFTHEEIRQIVSFVQSQIHEVKDGERGEDGDTPVRGVDYWTDKDKLEIVQEVLKRVRKPKDGRDAVLTTELIQKAFNELPDEQKPLTRSELDGLKQTINVLSHQVGMRGGGDTVVAGSNVTITTNGLGQKIIASTGGTGGVSFETPPESSGTTFTVANPPMYIIVNGVTYFEGLGYTYSTGTITLDFPLTGWIRSAYA